MSSYWKKWFKAAGIRAVRTFAQVFVTSMPTTAVAIGSVHWGLVLSTAAVSAIVSLMTSLAGIPEVEKLD